MKETHVLKWLNDLIGQDVALTEMLEGRIFLDKAERGTPNPSLVYQITSMDFEEYLGNKLDEDHTIVIELRCYAKSRDEASEMRYKLANILNRVTCERVNISYQGEEASFLPKYSKFSGFTYSYEEGIENNGDDYGAIGQWLVTASE